jgi:hypothetical protein
VARTRALTLSDRPDLQVDTPHPYRRFINRTDAFVTQGLRYGHAGLFGPRVLRLLEDRSRLTQREMVRDLGVTLGKVNYCLRARIGKRFRGAQKLPQERGQARLRRRVVESRRWLPDSRFVRRENPGEDG